MKDFFDKHWVAVLALILAVLLVIPVSAGIKLEKKYNKVFSSFDKNAAKSDAHGHSLINDLSNGINEAKACIDAAKHCLDISDDLIRNAESAVRNYRNVNAPHENYRVFMQVCNAVERVYNAAIDKLEDSHELESAYIQLLSYQSIITKNYSEEYNLTLNKANNTIAGFPRAIIAKFYNIGKS